MDWMSLGHVGSKDQIENHRKPYNKISNDHQHPLPGASKWSHLPLKEA